MILLKRIKEGCLKDFLYTNKIYVINGRFRYYRRSAKVFNDI